MTKLHEIEVRVLGSLAEKEITTPDYYPLSLNALINACNQKSNRDPVMALDERVVTQALDSLNEKSLAGQVTSADSRVPKYAHRLQEVFNFDRREMAVLCVLLLRGPQTPGELRGRAERMYQFDDIGLRDGLRMPNRQRVIVVGFALFLRRHKQVARDLAQGGQNAGVANAASFNLFANHLFPPGLVFIRG